MNTRPIIDDSAKPVALAASFNADNKFFAVSHDTGFRVFSSEKCELFKSHDAGAGIGCAEMLGSTQYIALVGGGSQPKFPPNKVAIWDAQKKTTLCKMEFQSSVQSVRICRTHIIVVLLNSVNLYQFSSPPKKIAVFETASNPLGLCCLGSKMVAFPGRTLGQVQLVELQSRTVSIISAHEAPLRALAISPDGLVLTTASETGTLIRIWSTSKCTRIGELRRGVDPAIIFSMAINPSNTSLAVTSDKSTLHIFDLPHPTRATAKQQHSSQQQESHNGATDGTNPSQKWGVLARIPLLPRVFKDVYSFASAHFEIGDEPAMWRHGGGARSSSSGNNSTTASPTNSVQNLGGMLGARRPPPPKGLIGWLDDEELVVVGAGEDARWERFRVGVDDEGKRVCVRQAWKRYMYV